MEGKSNATSEPISKKDHSQDETITIESSESNKSANNPGIIEKPSYLDITDENAPIR